jgi:cell division protein FtsI/penicillin-binding protein 2
MARSRKRRRHRLAAGLLWAVPLALAVTGAALRAAPRPMHLAVASAHAADAPAKQARPSTNFGDAWLAGKLDLSKKTLDGDRYVITLPGGARAVLTLDPALQARAEALLDEADAPFGAIVVMAADGRLLAIAGRSSAEPALGTIELALRPWAPSASVFKLVTAAALVEAGVKPDAEVCVHGGLRSVEADDLEDDAKQDSLCGSLAYGVAKSQNAMIAKLATRHLDKARLERAAAALGYGAAPAFALAASPSTIDLPDDRLELARASAGFWHSTLSPLGGALVAATIADGGLRPTPRIVAAVADAAGELPIPGAAPVRVLDARVAAAVGEMMVGVTETGTAAKAFHDARGRRLLGETRVAGKTGSLSREQPSYLNFSWFVGFAPADAPQIVVSVCLGNSATWRFKSHTIARLLLETALAR